MSNQDTIEMCGIRVTLVEPEPRYCDHDEAIEDCDDCRHHCHECWYGRGVLVDHDTDDVEECVTDYGF